MMAQRKRPMKDGFFQAKPANPVWRICSSQDLNAGENLGQRTDDLKPGILPLLSDPNLAPQAPEALRSGLCFQPGNMTTEQFVSEESSSWCSDQSFWPSCGGSRSGTFYQSSDAHPSVPFSSPTRQVQNDMIMYEDACPADAGPDPWNTTLEIPGHCPHRMQDVLAGIPDGQYYQDYQAHPAMQEFNWSDVSSLSSSYQYTCPEFQASVVGHDLLSHVPWSRPNTLGENTSRMPSWSQSTKSPAQPMTSMTPEPADSSGMHIRFCLWIGRTPMK